MLKTLLDISWFLHHFVFNSWSVLCLSSRAFQSATDIVNPLPWFLFACWSHSLAYQYLIDGLHNYYIFFFLFFFLPFFPSPGTHGIMLHNKTFPLGILGIQACSLFLQWSMTARQCFFFPFWICAASLSTRLAAPVEAQLVTLSAAWGAQHLFQWPAEINIFCVRSFTWLVRVQDYGWKGYIDLKT